MVWRNRKIWWSERAHSENTGGYAINNRGDLAIGDNIYLPNGCNGSADIRCEWGSEVAIDDGVPACMNDADALVVDRGPYDVPGRDTGPEKGRVVGNRFVRYYLETDGVKFAIEVPSNYTDEVDSVAEISDRNEVVGNLGTQMQTKQQGPPVEEAFAWRKGHFTVFGSFGGYGSLIGGINGQGEIVGSASIPGNAADGVWPSHAFLFEHRRLYDLNHFISPRSGWTLTHAWAINNRGQILCSGNKGLCLLMPM